jgi:hypothetical protein
MFHLQFNSQSLLLLLLRALNRHYQPQKYDKSVKKASNHINRRCDTKGKVVPIPRGKQKLLIDIKEKKMRQNTRYNQKLVQRKQNQLIEGRRRATTFLGKTHRLKTRT